LLDIRARTKVQLVLMIHDLFVIERPEWFEPRFAKLFGAEFKRLAPGVDRWVTNSSFVTDQLRRHLADQSLEEKPIAALPMGWDSFPSSQGRSIHEMRGSDEILSRFGLAERKFILFVGTVEPRKNLPLLLDALDELRGRSDRAVPDLVVVGGRGWRSQEVRARLKRDPNVHWLRAVNDRELAALYRHACFTVAPSIIEGWGLPVQESLAHGVPCIASNAGAHPEAGLDLAEYFESGNSAELSAALAIWIKDDNLLAERRLAIQQALQSTRLPTWDDAAEALLRHVFADVAS
jgi:glycosyltransferase involved in cell wall biosynthesis